MFTVFQTFLSFIDDDENNNDHDQGGGKKHGKNMKWWKHVEAKVFFEKCYCVYAFSQGMKVDTRRKRRQKLKN